MFHISISVFLPDKSIQLLVQSQSLVFPPERMSDLALNLTLAGEDVTMEEMNIKLQSAGVIKLAVVSAVFILAVNIPIIQAIKKEKKYTFINILVCLDCMDSLAHIPCLAQ